MCNSLDDGDRVSRMYAVGVVPLENAIWRFLWRKFLCFLFQFVVVDKLASGAWNAWYVRSPPLDSPKRMRIRRTRGRGAQTRGGVAVYAGRRLVNLILSTKVGENKDWGRRPIFFSPFSFRLCRESSQSRTVSSAPRALYCTAGNHVTVLGHVWMVGWRSKRSKFTPYLPLTIQICR